MDDKVRPAGVAMAAMQCNDRSPKTTPTVVSFFSGCGGMDLGFEGGFTYRGDAYETLPFRILRAYEMDEKCVTTYRANFATPIEQCDLATADVGLMPQADVLIGGFPCQEFSICGPKGGTGSKRGMLYLSMSRYARRWKPRLVVGENVAHLPRLNQGADFKNICRSFAAAGYRAALWKAYAPDFGVPQARERVFLVFVRSDQRSSPVPPVPTHADSPRSVRWAIQDLECVTDESVPNQSQYFKAGLAKSGHGQGDERSPADQPGYTVRANAKSRVHFHYCLERRLTVRECARLQTFPDTFAFPHAATPNIRQIGNAVPPVLAHAFAKSISKFLEDQ